MPPSASTAVAHRCSCESPSSSSGESPADANRTRSWTRSVTGGSPLDRFGLRLSATRRHITDPLRPAGDCRWATVVSTHASRHRSGAPRGAVRGQADYDPSGDQPAAIAEITKRIQGGEQDIVLLGATGTGKTATVAWVAEQVQRPILVMQPNKTLAAQFANELRQLFPDNAVEYFVSYYDYYQPEAYVPPDRHLHREGLLDQRGGRAAAALGDQLAAHPARRDRGGRCRASTASAPRRSTSTGCSGSRSARSTTATASCASWSRCSTRATT